MRSSSAAVAQPRGRDHDGKIWKIWAEIGKNTGTYSNKYINYI